MHFRHTPADLPKNNKSHIKIDEHHVYMIGKYGPVIKYEKDGVTEFKNVKKDLDLDKLKNGEYKLENIIVEKPKFGGRNLGSFKRILDQFEMDFLRCFIICRLSVKF